MLKAVIKYSQRTAQYYIEDLGNGVELEMVLIPGGTFTMGAPEDEEGSKDNQRPQHQVTVPTFFMGRYQVTQAQWRAVMNLTPFKRTLNREPSHFKGDNLPVESVSWYDAVEFCTRLSNHSRRKYRLPSEAEWEYACRAGTTTPFHFGETITTDLANFSGRDDKYRKWVSPDSNISKEIYPKKTTPVGSFNASNAFGLSDMHGNVYEWCLDDWHNKYEKAPTDGSAWVKSDGNNNNNDRPRLLRGGSWYDITDVCRSANRHFGIPNLYLSSIGLRVVCSIAP